MKTDLREEIELPEQTTVQLGKEIKIVGPKGEVQKKLVFPNINVSLEDNKIVLEAKNGTKREKKILNAFQSHLKNMVRGVNEKHVYRLKICSGHFPMNVSLSGKQLIVKNFLGESVPRKLEIRPDVEVKIEGDQIIVSSNSKESAGQVAGGIEQLTRIRNKDVRIFQDGCYMIHKSGKDI
ncbi:MAG: 50S ribosomal protein L6 [Candidatus Woesearchaeota archaeon]